MLLYSYTNNRSFNKSFQLRINIDAGWICIYLSRRRSTFVRIPSIKSVDSTRHGSKPFRPNPDPSGTITVELSTYIYFRDLRWLASTSSQPISDKSEGNSIPPSFSNSVDNRPLSKRFNAFSWTSFLDFLNGLRRANSRLYFLRFNLIEIIEVIGYSGEKFNALQSRFCYLRLVDRGWGFY